MEIEVPEFFVVSDCPKCETRHAPVRECMHFDRIFVNNQGFYESTPENTKQFLLTKVEARENTRAYHVIDGRTLTHWTVEEYLSR